MKILALIGIIILVLGCILIPTSCRIVPPGHRGVSVTLGKIDDRLLGEGLVWKKPFIEHIEKLPIQQTRRDGTTECFSSDLQTINVHFVALYRRPENKVIELYRLYKGDPYENLLEPRINECLKQVTATYPAEKLVISREEVRSRTITAVRAAVGDLMILNDLNIINIDLTDDLERAIESKMIQEQQALAKRFELEKEKKQAEIVVVRAEAEATAVRITGEALSRAPKVIELELVKKWDGKAPQTVVVGQGGADIVLPLSTK